MWGLILKIIIAVTTAVAGALGILKRLSPPQALIVGHRDLNPHKACPCFDAEWEYGDL